MYEKQLKIHRVNPTVAATTSIQNNLKKKLSGASLLDNCYSKTLIDTHNLKPSVDIKEVSTFLLLAELMLKAK